MAGLVGYGVYSYVSEQQLKALLPEGVAMPENRAQTALLLWNTVGRPEPAEAPAFKDVADPDTAKAAQWCVGRGLKNKHPQRTAPELKQPGHALRMLLLCGGARRLKQKIRALLLSRKGSDFHGLVRVVIQHFLKTIVVQFVFKVIG